MSKLLGVVCVAVLCVILTLGLWPFHPPKNNVVWLKQESGLSFGHYGTVLSSGDLKPTSSADGLCGSLELWVQPDRWTSATILAFYGPESHRLFRLQQSVSDLDLEFEGQIEGRVEGKDNESQVTGVRLYSRDAFGPSLRGKKAVFITVTQGLAGTRVYLDGTLATAASKLLIPRGAFTGRVIVGDSPLQPDSFRGQIRGLAVYDVELTDEQILRHYTTWTRNRFPEIAANERAAALYLFDEKAGRVIHNLAAVGADLYIPETYTVVDKIALEPFWREFNMSQSYGKAALINVVGFIPVGFVFYAYFRIAPPIRSAMLAAVAVGAATSLTIEILQAFLPTRDSGTTDLLTNTFGTYIGALFYRDAYPIFTKRLPWFGRFLAPLFGKATATLPEQS